MIHNNFRRFELTDWTRILKFMHEQIAVICNDRWFLAFGVNHQKNNFLGFWIFQVWNPLDQLKWPKIDLIFKVIIYQTQYNTD